LLDQIVAINKKYNVFYEYVSILAPYAVLARYEEGYEISSPDALALYKNANKIHKMIVKIYLRQL
jgi:hypothetical protein